MTKLQGFPTGFQYQEAVQHPARCFADPELKGASCERMAMGLPKMISGNFASVFPMTSAAGNRYAVKCFTRTVVNQMERYSAIGDCLGKVQPWWATGFEYMPNGIEVETDRYPILRMNWVRGLTLGNWIAQNFAAPSAIENIGRLFDSLVADLSAMGIAHGDLQSGNLIVADAGTLRLVDYDGMYVQGLEAFPPGEVGHPDYQRRERSQADYGPSMDRFSAWLISLSLKILAAEPGMLDRLNPSRDEYLLLNRQDFLDLRSSPRFAILSSSQNAEVRRLAHIAADVLPLPLSAMPVLAIPTPSRVRAVPTPMASGGSAMPGWMQSHVSSMAATGTGGPVSGQQALHTTSQPTRVTCWLTRFALTLLVVGLPILLVLYSRDSLTREYTGLRRARRKAAAVMRRASRDVRKSRGLTQGLERAESALVARFEKQQAAIRADFDRKRSGISRELAVIDRKIESLDKQRQREFGLRLTVVQRNFVQNYLSSAKLDSSRITGIGSQLIANLQAVGIRSAGDFTGVSYAQGGRYVTAYFQRTHGGRVHVQGIGQVKADAIEQWRRLQVSGAHFHQPATLASDDVRAIEASYSSSINALKDQRRQAEVRVNAEVEALRPELDRALASAADEHRIKVEALGPRKSEVGARLGQAQVEYLSARQEYLDWGTQMTAYKSWRFARFVYTAARGSPPS
jgi:hypothetical protein